MTITKQQHYLLDIQGIVDSENRHADEKAVQGNLRNSHDRRQAAEEFGPFPLSLSYHARDTNFNDRKELQIKRSPSSKEPF